MWRTVKNFSPQRQTLQYIRVLLRMVMAQPRAALATPDRQTTLAALRVRRVEVLLKVQDHPIARVAVRPQERVVVAYTVEALADLLLAEVLALILRSQRLYRTLLRLDLLLDVASRAALGVDLLRRDRDCVFAEHVESTMLFEDGVHGLNWADARKPEHVLDFWRLAVLR